MGKVLWYVNRLRAMSLKEVLWRLGQKRQESSELKYYRHPQRVDSVIFNPQLKSLQFDSQKLGLVYDARGHEFRDSISLLGEFAYSDYKNQWHAGFQTSNKWEKTYSPQLNYKQRDEIGDARTNWELNRHYQLALLAKNYCFSGEEKWADELASLYEDWNDSNPYLIGISWTSVMEVAIRAISWCFALAFLQQSGNHTDLQRRMSIGILNMVDTVNRHHSRYSSANNHLLVEMTSMAIAGYCFGHKPWTEKAVRILTEELPKQNYRDGVNKEMSLHYQLFVMEAYALTAHFMIANEEPMPELWKQYICALCEFTCHSTYGDGQLMEFGDNDEGKIIDLQGGSFSHADYVMQLCSLLTETRYSSFSSPSETLRCLFGDGYEQRMRQLPQYVNSKSRCFVEGGYTFLRSNDQKTLIGIDHAPLGYGSIAAHGHADALSFQLMEAGEKLFVDPGTYIYHCDITSRNRFRQTINHNTLCIAEKDQSEMLGAFLWGKKAHCHLLNCELGEQVDIIEAEQDGYRPVIHKRRFTWDKDVKTLRIDDTLSSSCEWTLSFVLGADCKVSDIEEGYLIEGKRSKCILRPPREGYVRLDTTECSDIYGKKQFTSVLRVHGHSLSSVTVISIL